MQRHQHRESKPNAHIPRMVPRARVWVLNRSHYRRHRGRGLLTMRAGKVEGSESRVAKWRNQSTLVKTDSHCSRTDVLPSKREGCTSLPRDDFAGLFWKLLPEYCKEYGTMEWETFVTMSVSLMLSMRKAIELCRLTATCRTTSLWP